MQDDLFTPLQSFGIKVLLVDDQPMISEAVRRCLQDQPDIEFHYCQDPTRAVKMANEIEPTCILQDLVMPEIDGLLMVRFFRANKKTQQTPIIVLSTKEEAEVKSQAFTMGANDYLVKLPATVELIARIRYHSKSYINLKERDEAFRALKESQGKLEAANRELEKLSSLDGLTGIPNRRHFDESLGKEWHRAMRAGVPLSLIMLDIDFFKLYNDHYGHQGGDDCLKRVAAILAGVARRDTDIVARYGGEEFAVILPDTDQAGAEQIAESLRAAVQGSEIPHKMSKVGEYVSISVGVGSGIPARNISPELLIKAADQALYKAKEEGRNRVKTGTLAP